MNLINMLRQHPLSKTLAFSTAEYAGRLEAVRLAMGMAGVDILLVGNSANQCWLTGYESVMPSAPTLAIVPASGPVEMISADLDASCIELYSTVTTVHVEGWSTGRDITTILLERLRDLGADHKTVGVELGKVDGYASMGIDAATYLVLVEQLSKSRWVDTTLLIPQLRLIKSPVELEYMRLAGQYTEQGMKAAIDAIAVGKTDNDIAAAYYHAATVAGSEVMSIDPQIVTGERCGYMPFLTYKRIPLKQGDTVYLECTGVHQRYNAPLMRSAVIGQPNDTALRIADIALEIMDELLAAIAPGRNGLDIASEMAPLVKRLPEGCYFSGTYGYATGLGMQPTWSEYPAYIADGMEFELAENMTFHTPIAIWSVRDRVGVGFSETIKVTGSGCELITPGGFRELVVR
ncbi:M24 family metallopeptidase [Pseudomonas asiatica]|uniref:M24 family metallopeptidase n=1 Tax=Pseudomonas asiatica TaxID=2219225 RepID=UPI00383A9997